MILCCANETSRKHRLRQEYIEANYTIVVCTQNRFEEATWIHRSIHGPTLESLLTKTCEKRKGILWREYGLICNLFVYHSKFDKEQILVQLQLFDANFDVVTSYGAMDIFHLK